MKDKNDNITGTNVSIISCDVSVGYLQCVDIVRPFYNITIQPLLLLTRF